VVARVLCARGYTTPEAVEAFLSAPRGDEADPFQLCDMDAAAERVVAALERNEAIAVYGDYDVDGQTATALVVAFLRRFGARVGYYVPRRLEEGYGLHEPALRQLRERGADLVITVDCGATALGAAEEAAALGLDLVITDHHRMGGGELPLAAALVNPHRPGCPYPYKHLAGVGVAYRLAQAVWKRAGEPPEADPDDFLDLVALGTVADVMPLTGENRSLVSLGLERMNARLRPGLAAMAEAAGLEGTIDAHHLAFILAPRLNAAGRLDDPSAGVKLLLTAAEAEARELAARLERLNRLRRSLEDFIVEQARTQVEEALAREAPALVVAGEGWHPGVLGLVASRLVEGYYRPTLALGIEGDRARGSGRAVDGFDLYAALGGCADLLDTYGGHELAAGFSLQARRLPELRERFAEAAYRQLAEPLAAGELLPVVRVDAEVDLGALDEPLLEQLDALGPFGPGNPTPVLGARRLRVADVRAVGAGGAHLQVTLEDPQGGGVRRGIGFRLGELAEHVRRGDWVQAAFGLQLDTWQGRREVRLRLKALEPVVEQPVVRVRSQDNGSAAAAQGDAQVEPGAVELVAEDRREGTPAYVGAGSRRALLAAELHEQRGPAVLIVLDTEEREAALRVWPEGADRIVALVEDDRPFGPLAPARAAWAEWTGRAGAVRGGAELHVVVACLPPLPGFLAPWFASAAGHASRVRLHLAYGRADGARAAAALERHYPSRATLVRCWRMWRDVAPSEDGAGWGTGEGGGMRNGADGALRGSRRAVAVREPPAIPLPVRRAAVRIFQEMGLMKREGERWRLTPPPDGSRLNLLASPFYAEGEKLRAALQRWTSRALEADPDAAARALCFDLDGQDR